MVTMMLDGWYTGETIFKNIDTDVFGNVFLADAFRSSSACDIFEQTGDNPDVYARRF